MDEKKKLRTEYTAPWSRKITVCAREAFVLTVSGDGQGMDPMIPDPEEEW